jgi:16S rRNA processing protein RimM
MVRIRWLGDGPENLMQARELAIGRSLEPQGTTRHRVISRLPGRAGEVRIAFEGIGDRDAAEALRGAYVFAEATGLAELPEGEHYWYELIGCRVETRSGETIGLVEEIWETGAHDVLVVTDERGRKILLPAAKGILREIDVVGRRLRIEEIPGLLDPA